MIKILVRNKIQIIFEKEIIAAAIFFKYGYFGHYHLAGSLREYKEYNPNAFLISETAWFLKNNNITLFHLGGGSTTSPVNSLFLFKKKSPIFLKRSGYSLILLFFSNLKYFFNSISILTDCE